MADIGISVGLETSEAKKEADSYLRTLDDIIKKHELIEKSVIQVNKETKAQAKETKAAASSVDTLVGRYDKQLGSLRRLQKDQEALNKALSSGKVTQEEHSRVLAGINAAQNKLTEASKKAAEAQIAEAKAAKALAKETQAVAKAKKQAQGADHRNVQSAIVMQAQHELAAIAQRRAAQMADIEQTRKAIEDLASTERMRARWQAQDAAKLAERQEAEKRRLREIEDNMAKLTATENKRVAKQVKTSFQANTKAENTAAAQTAKIQQERAKIQERLLSQYAPMSQQTKKLAQDLDFLAKSFDPRRPREYAEAMANIRRQQQALAQVPKVGGVDKLSTGMGTLLTRMSPLPSLLHLITMGFSVFTAARTIGSIYQTVLAIDSLKASLSVLSTGQEQAATRFRFLVYEADRLGVSIEAMANEYKQFAAAAQAADLSDNVISGMFSAILEASRSLKLSADDTSGTVRALQQMLSKSKISAEELNAMAH